MGYNITVSKIEGNDITKKCFSHVKEIHLKDKSTIQLSIYDRMCGFYMVDPGNDITTPSFSTDDKVFYTILKNELFETYTNSPTFLILNKIQNLFELDAFEWADINIDSYYLVLNLKAFKMLHEQLSNDIEFEDNYKNILEQLEWKKFNSTDLFFINYS
jgi:hypothetical protein